MSSTTLLAEWAFHQELAEAGVTPPGATRLPHAHELAAQTRFGDLDVLQDEATEQVTAEVAVARDAMLAALVAYLLSLHSPSPAEVLAAVAKLNVAATLTLLGPEYRLARERSLAEVGDTLRRFVVTSQDGMVAEVARQGVDVAPRDTPGGALALLDVLAGQAVDNPLSKAVTAAQNAARASLTDSASADPVRTVIRAVTAAVAPVNAARRDEIVDAVTRQAPVGIAPVVGPDGKVVTPTVTQPVSPSRSAVLDGVDAGTRDLARQAVGQAEAAGRLDVLTDLDGRGRFYASELRDRNTCEPCSVVDATEYPDLAAALADYPTAGGFRACLGGLRCRGTLVFVSERETAPTLYAPGDGR